MEEEEIELEDDLLLSNLSNELENKEEEVNEESGEIN